MQSPLDGTRVVDLPRNPSGPCQVSFVEFDQHVPFQVMRAYWIHTLKAGEVRGHHAHRTMQQLLVATSGGFEITLDDGIERKCFLLDNPASGLLVQAGLWREIRTLQDGAVLMALASTHFDESDYIRDYSIFLEFAALRARVGTSD